MKSFTRLTLVAATLICAGTYSFGQQSATRIGEDSGSSSSASGTASGQSSDQSGKSADAQVLQQLRQFAQDPNTAADKLFVLEAAKGNMKEQMFAQVIEQKAQNPEVKQLAQHIMKDHQQAQQQLQQVAQSLGIQLPQELPQAEQAMIQVIASLPTDQLEKHYVAGMTADHARDILKYQCEASMGKNDQVRQYAKQTLPALEQHAQMTVQTAQAIGVQMDMNAVPAAARFGAEGSSSSSGGQSGKDHTTSGSSSDTGTGGNNR